MSGVIGVDPGVKGGVAFLWGDGSIAKVIAFQPWMTHREVVDLLRGPIEVLSLSSPERPVAFVEKVGYMPGDGGKGSNTFGRVDGLLRGALLMARVEIRDVYPMVWQTKMECLSGGNKNVTKTRAQSLFPGIKVTHAIADALLIAEYGRRTLNP